MIENFYINLFTRYEIKHVVYSHPWKSYYAIPVWIAVKNKINCFHMASANEALRIAKLANTRNFYQPFECMSFNEFSKLTKLKQTKSAEEGKKYMAKRISGKTKDYNARNAFDFKDNSNELIDIRKQLLINNNNPIVVIYGHAWYDFPHCLNMKNFLNFYDWIKSTYDFVKNINNINWVFKPHPLENWYGGFKMKDIVKSNKKNIYCPSINIDSYSVMMKSDVIITVFGTVGLEATLLRQKVLFADVSHYSDWNIGTISKSREEYFKYLNNIKTIKYPNKEQINKASSFIYFSMAPHPQKSNLINFDDDIDQKHIHKQIHNFQFEKIQKNIRKQYLSQSGLKQI